MSNVILKPFNLEAALKGDKVVTRGGTSVIGFTYHKGLDDGDGSRCISGVLVNSDHPGERLLLNFKKDGKYLGFGGEHSLDLFMQVKHITEKKQVAVYEDLKTRKISFDCSLVSGTPIVGYRISTRVCIGYVSVDLSTENMLTENSNEW